MDMERSFIHDPTCTIIMYYLPEGASCGDVGEQNSRCRSGAWGEKTEIRREQGDSKRNRTAD
jgi:hypothetical protein